MSQALVIALAYGDRAFIPAFEKLADQISVDRSIALLGEMNADMSLMNEGLSGSPSVALEMCASTAFLHVATGAPLYLSNELFDAWQASDGSFDQCGNEQCRYRQPRGYSAWCASCGGAVHDPESLWEKSGLPADEIASLKLLIATVSALAGQLSPDRLVRLLLQIETHLRRFLAGLAPESSILLQAVLVIAHQHTAWQTPLYLDDALFDRWASAEHPGAVECGACGYRMPEDTPVCVLCGGAVGDPGVFRQNRERRARMAGMN